MKYHSRGLRQRRDTDQWEVTLMHSDPLSGEMVPSYHTVTAKTQRQAERRRDELIFELERKGGAASSRMTLSEFLDAFIEFKETSGTVEASTLNHYRKQARVIARYIGDVKLTDTTIPVVNGWMAQMTAEGYAPRSVLKPFSLLKQALKHAMALDLITKNPCDYCRPPKLQRKTVNALSRDERTRMLELAIQAEPSPLALAIEIALTTGMRRGEVCGLRWSDLGEDGTLTINRAVSLDSGTVYVKEPKTQGSRRTIPLTQHLFTSLSTMRDDFLHMMEHLGIRNADTYILGRQEPDARPYHPTRLTREFTSFSRMNGFDCTFHDLRHTFATMMIAGGTDVRTVASYLGHSNVAMTLNTYAEVDPDTKRAAVGRIEESFDLDLTSTVNNRKENTSLKLEFTIEQLRAMLAEAELRAEISTCE